MAADSHAKGHRRRPVRGVRALAREVWAERRTHEPPARLAPPGAATPSAAVQADEASQEVVRDDGAAVRGIRNGAPGGPLHPPGGRLAAAWEDVHAALQRHVAAQQGGQRPSAVHGEQATSHEG